MMAKNIQGVSDSYLCCNCGACFAACPHGAIDFRWSNVGRLYAQVNDRCTDCGICQKVCPSLDLCGVHEAFADKFVGEIRNVYVGRSLDDAIFRNAQSGGLATACVRYLFDKGLIDAALLCRMDFGATPKVSPCVVTSVEQLGATQGSCYTPVSLLAALSEVRRFKSVAIVGLPCHLQGLWALSRFAKRYSNITYRFGLICDRTECSGIQKVIKQRSNLEMFKIRWRRKFDPKSRSFNYKSAPLVAISSDGEEKILSRDCRLGLKDMFTPPRCFVCPDKLASFADIAFGDPWGLSGRGIDHTKGASLVVVRNERGENLLRNMSECGYVELNVRSVDELLFQSQNVDSRRIRVADYSEGFAVLPNFVNSHLLRVSGLASKLGKDRAERTLLDFVDLERADCCSMLAKAEEAIEAYGRVAARKRSMLGRMWRLLIRCVRGRKG